MAVKFFSTNCDDTGGQGPGTQIDVKQVTKLNIIASQETPHESIIDIKFDNTFKRLPIEILRADGFIEDEIEVLANFDNSDATDFEANEFVIFDGKMYLTTQQEKEFEIENKEENIYKYNTASLLSKIKKLESFEVI